MAIPTVKTWTTGEVPSAANLQAQVSDPITFAINPPCAIVARAANQSIASGASAYLSWDTEVADNRAMFAPTSDTVTITESGLYLATAWGRWDTNPTGIRVLEVHQNGITITSESGNASGSTSDHRDTVVAPLACAVGDVIKINTFQNSGSTLNMTGRLIVVRLSG